MAQLTGEHALVGVTSVLCRLLANRHPVWLFACTGWESPDDPRTNPKSRWRIRNQGSAEFPCYPEHAHILVGALEK